MKNQRQRHDNMKKTQNKFETSITLDTSTRDTLKMIKEKNGFRTYNEVLLNLLDAKQGYLNELKVIKRPQVAFTLTMLLFNKDGVQVNDYTTPVTYKELKTSEVGDQFGFKQSDTKSDYVNETCTVLYSDGDLVIVKVDGETNKSGNVEYYTHIFAVDLI